MIVTVTPADLRPGDRVLLNGGWWTLLETVPPRNGKRWWGLILDHDDDTIEVYRRDDAHLTVDRAEP